MALLKFIRPHNQISYSTVWQAADEARALHAAAVAEVPPPGCKAFLVAHSLIPGGA